jgi:hypothetical protein
MHDIKGELFNALAFIKGWLNPESQGGYKRYSVNYKYASAGQRNISVQMSFGLHRERERLGTR